MTNSVTVLHGDAIGVLRTLPDSSVDVVITDPPYGLSNTDPRRVAETIAAWVSGERHAIPAGKGFMAKSWDSFVPPPAVWDECFRVLKPGGHMAVFAGSRTQDLMGLSIRLAGFDIRDSLSWIYGSGFPKSMDVSKAIDKAAGVERTVVGTKKVSGPEGSAGGFSNGISSHHGNDSALREVEVTAATSDEAKQWEGWGTALKPAQEPIILARKPIVGTVAKNVLEHGTGAINIDDARVPSGEVTGWGGAAAGGQTWNESNMGLGKDGAPRPVEGRWPANVLLDEHAAAAMDQQSGHQKDGVSVNRNRDSTQEKGGYEGGWKKDTKDAGYGSGGGASRFFHVFKYQAKASKKERPVIELEDGTSVQHPTVKPLALMEWLCTLLTPPDGVVLDPFAGSGSTLQAARDAGFRAIGVEREEEYVDLIKVRLGE